MMEKAEAPTTTREEGDEDAEVEDEDDDDEEEEESEEEAEDDDVAEEVIYSDGTSIDEVDSSDSESDAWNLEKHECSECGGGGEGHVDSEDGKWYCDACWVSFLSLAEGAPQKSVVASRDTDAADDEQAGASVHESSGEEESSFCACAECGENGEGREDSDGEFFCFKCFAAFEGDEGKDEAEALSEDDVLLQVKDTARYQCKPRRATARQEDNRCAPGEMKTFTARVYENSGDARRSAHPLPLRKSCSSCSASEMGGHTGENGEHFCDWCWFECEVHDEQEECDESSSWPCAGDTDSLPIEEYREQIARHVQDHTVTSILGETGCGKSSMVPQFILEDCRARGECARILVTQPRRIAAIMLARRVAHCRQEPVGRSVGYRVGNREHRDSKRTQITFCTVGYVLAYLSHNPLRFCEYTHLVLDEVHERSVDADLLHYLIKALMERHRHHVKLVIMSATLKMHVFERYFTPPDEPVHDAIFVGVKRFPVRQIFLDTLADEIPGVAEGLVGKVAGAFRDQHVHAKLSSDAKKLVVECAQAVAAPGSSVLVFLPGMDEMCAVQEEMEQRMRAVGLNAAVHVLHSLVSEEDQHAALAPPQHTESKIILATNIAESSITIADIEYVIDSAIMRGIVYDEQRKIQCLRSMWCSRASIRQRAGRVGRVKAGTVIHLITSAFHDCALRDFEEEEMTRMPLTKTVLNVKLLFAHLGAPSHILRQLLSPPPASRVRDAIAELHLAGATTGSGEDATVTALGETATRMPVDLPLCKLVMLGASMGAQNAAIIMAAALSQQDVFCLPMAVLFKDLKEWSCELAGNFAARCKFDGGQYSEPLMYLRVYQAWLTSRRDALWCKRKRVSMVRMKMLDACVASLAASSKHLLEQHSLHPDLLYKLEQAALKRTHADMSMEEAKVLVQGSNLPVLHCMLAGAFSPVFLVGEDSKGAEQDAIKHGFDPRRALVLGDFMPKNVPAAEVASALEAVLQATNASTDSMLLYELRSLVETRARPKLTRAGLRFGIRAGHSKRGRNSVRGLGLQGNTSWEAASRASQCWWSASRLECAGSNARARMRLGCVGSVAASMVLSNAEGTGMVQQAGELTISKYKELQGGQLLIELRGSEVVQQGTRAKPLVANDASFPVKVLLHLFKQNRGKLSLPNPRFVVGGGASEFVCAIGRAVSCRKLTWRPLSLGSGATEAHAQMTALPSSRQPLCQMADFDLAQDIRGEPGHGGSRARVATAFALLGTDKPSSVKAQGMTVLPRGALSSFLLLAFAARHAHMRFLVRHDRRGQGCKLVAALCSNVVVDIAGRFDLAQLNLLRSMMSNAIAGLQVSPEERSRVKKLLAGIASLAPSIVPGAGGPEEEEGRLEWVCSCQDADAADYFRPLQLESAGTDRDLAHAFPALGSPSLVQEHSEPQSQRNSNRSARPSAAGVARAVGAVLLPLLARQRLSLHECNALALSSPHVARATKSKGAAAGAELCVLGTFFDTHPDLVLRAQVSADMLYEQVLVSTMEFEEQHAASEDKAVLTDAPYRAAALQREAADVISGSPSACVGEREKEKDACGHTRGRDTHVDSGGQRELQRESERDSHAHKSNPASTLPARMLDDAKADGTHATSSSTLGPPNDKLVPCDLRGFHKERTCRSRRAEAPAGCLPGQGQGQVMMERAHASVQSGGVRPEAAAGDQGADDGGEDCMSGRLQTLETYFIALLRRHGAMPLGALNSAVEADARMRAVCQQLFADYEERFAALKGAKGGGKRVRENPIARDGAVKQTFFESRKAVFMSSTDMANKDCDLLVSLTAHPAVAEVALKGLTKFESSAHQPAYPQARQVQMNGQERKQDRSRKASSQGAPVAALAGGPSEVGLSGVYISNGWQEWTTSDGRKYYHLPAKQLSQWEPPAEEREDKGTGAQQSVGASIGEGQGGTERGRTGCLWELERFLVVWLQDKAEVEIAQLDSAVEQEPAMRLLVQRLAGNRRTRRRDVGVEQKTGKLKRAFFEARPHVFVTLERRGVCLVALHKSGQKGQEGRLGEIGQLGRMQEAVQQSAQGRSASIPGAKATGPAGEAGEAGEEKKDVSAAPTRRSVVGRAGRGRAKK